MITNITRTCESLFRIGSVSFYNSVREESTAVQSRVSWPVRNGGSSHVHPFGSLEQYLQWVRNGEFTCLLFDHSIIRASYIFTGNRVVGHNLLFWPFPISLKEPLDEITEICKALELCLNSPVQASGICSLSLRSPMRFDYDPDLAGDGHPEVHLHMQFENTRIYVQQPLCFHTFLKLIFRTFYPEHWNEHRQLATLHQQMITPLRGDISPARHCLQMVWA
jgi:hypothetical protein